MRCARHVPFGLCIGILGLAAGCAADNEHKPAERGMLAPPAPTAPAGPVVVSPTASTDRNALVKVVGKLPAMAQPVVLWIHAVKNGDAELLARVFSSRIRDELAGTPWKEVLVRYERLWREKFGDWNPSDFRFHGTSFTEGQRDRGAVLVSFEPPGTRPRTSQVHVVREGQSWYVDQR